MASSGVVRGIDYVAALRTIRALIRHGPAAYCVHRLLVALNAVLDSVDYLRLQCQFHPLSLLLGPLETFGAGLIMNCPIRLSRYLVASIK